MDAYTDTDEVDEIEEDDRDRFADQLCSIGILGRLAPEHCVPLLAKYVCCEKIVFLNYTFNLTYMHRYIDCVVRDVNICINVSVYLYYTFSDFKAVSFICRLQSCLL